MQFLEVHNEDIRDLLSDEPAPPLRASFQGSTSAGGGGTLALRELGGSVSVAGASTWRVEDEAAALHLLRKGVTARSTGASAITLDGGRTRAGVGGGWGGSLGSIASVGLSRPEPRNIADLAAPNGKWPFRDWQRFANAAEAARTQMVSDW